MNPDLDVFVEQRDETAAQLEAVRSELPDARAAVNLAAADALAAGRRFNSISTRVIAAQRPAGECSPALVRIVDAARKVRDDADAAHTRAKVRLANLIWNAECLTADLDQLDRLISPAPMGGARPEIVKRIVPGPTAVDPIIFPAGRAASGEAA